MKILLAFQAHHSRYCTGNVLVTHSYTYAERVNDHSTAKQKVSVCSRIVFFDWI